MEEENDLTMKCSNCFYFIDNEYCLLQLDAYGDFYKVDPDSWCPEYHFSNNDI